MEAAEPDTHMTVICGGIFTDEVVCVCVCHLCRPLKVTLLSR